MHEGYALIHSRSLRASNPLGEDERRQNVLQSIFSRASLMIKNLLVVPFRKQAGISDDRLTVGFNKESEEILAHRKPVRHPRFFFKNKILIPYSSLKAKLQMVVDNKDLEEGVFSLSLEILLHH
jgi:hypothetical protein